MKEKMRMIIINVVICYFPWIIDVHWIEEKTKEGNFSKILCFDAYKFFSRYGKSSKHTYTHSRLLICRRFSRRRRRKKPGSKKKNSDVSTTLLLVVAVRANERADGCNNEEKSLAD